jgi:hypothetical protein
MLLDFALFNVYKKSIIVKPVFLNLFDILPKIRLSNQVSGQISSIQPLPDIQYPALTGYPVSCFWISLDIRQKQYPVHP